MDLFFSVSRNPCVYLQSDSRNYLVDEVNEERRKEGEEELVLVLVLFPLSSDPTAQLSGVEICYG